MKEFYLEWSVLCRKPFTKYYWTKLTWNGCIQILNISNRKQPPSPADSVDQFFSRFNHLSFTLQLQFNYMLYVFYNIQVQRLSWPGHSSNFIFNFPVSCKLWTVCRWIAILEYKWLIPETFCNNWPQMCIQNLRMFLEVNITINWYQSS